MLVYNLSKGVEEPDLSSFNDADKYFVAVDNEGAERAMSVLGVEPIVGGKRRSAYRDVRFESRDGCDVVRLALFDLRGTRLVFGRLSFYLSENFFLLVISEEARRSQGDDRSNANARLIDMLKVGRRRADGSRDEPVDLYCRALDNAFSLMFDALSRYEESLGLMEDKVMTSPDKGDFAGIASLKGLSFKIKRSLRLMLHVGDKLTEDANNLVPARLEKSFRNLDVKINRLYEFSEEIHEMAEHLMNLYDSTATSRTNNMLNKLTIITVFATPPTVIASIYGMNFANMPGLESDYGYFAALALMALCLVGTYILLKRLKLL